MSVLLPVSTAVAKDDEIEACSYQSMVDGRSICIRTQSFNADLCAAMETLAKRSDVPVPFFARLIWRESLFRPEALSPKGAEGIAQFMPDTARLHGLQNSFHVVEALDTSARYLAELKERFGNFGLAAAAYNAGENGLRRFLSSGRLPLETRDYVFAITGQQVETWRDSPPEVAAPALDDGKSFIDACRTLANTRRMNEPVLVKSADWAPWGIQLAAHYNPAVADRLYTAAISRLPSPLNAERALIVRQRGGNFGYRPRYAARIGKETRTDAIKVCAAIKSNGVACTVFKNR
ncbi:transglycosylase SLT domain-containing protein [Neorhizobium alkalisoli]|jgi:soluble lytic murein transglycosylase-like protein|uniref:Soluble lytic murein transglycosylase-like protein n=1 Tax=Neorhizobium alkalisoli TaxID=528178 RepID=A0A561PVZ7_9HYPH|nr:lytic transglycosylase domain-containing protein [Neorhizobium alkalisoli]TWF42228.1 soluble lytic murein transglycosylase-like protein [Neorhizobium alkalisoli]